jgi:hypothetical protein
MPAIVHVFAYLDQAKSQLSGHFRAVKVANQTPLSRLEGGGGRGLDANRGSCLAAVELAAEFLEEPGEVGIEEGGIGVHDLVQRPPPQHGVDTLPCFRVVDHPEGSDPTQAEPVHLPAA